MGFRYAVINGVVERIKDDHDLEECREILRDFEQDCGWNWSTEYDSRPEDTQ